jgi:hypothetical protein
MCSPSFHLLVALLHPSIIHTQYQMVKEVSNQNRSERRFVGGRMECSIVGVLNVNQLFIPCLWMFSIVTSQQLYQCLVNNLCLSISLGMECSGIPQLGIHSLPKHCPKSTQEPAISIRYDGAWQSKMYPNMVEE